MDWNLPDWHKNQVKHQFDFKQRHETDRMYMLFMLRPASSKHAVFVDGADNVAEMKKSLLDFPRRGHNCDGGGFGFSHTDAVWFVLAEDTAAEGAANYILWELTPMLSGNHVEAWSTLVWACDETSSTMQKPAVLVSVENPDVEPEPTGDLPESDPSFVTDWSDASLPRSVNEYVLHGVPHVGVIHEGLIAVHSLLELYVLPQPEIVTPEGPCNPNGDWGAVEMPTDGKSVRLSFDSRDVQVVSCINGKVEASVTHVFIPSWTADQEVRAPRC